MTGAKAGSADIDRELERRKAELEEVASEVRKGMGDPRRRAIWLSLWRRSGLESRQMFTEMCAYAGVDLEALGITPGTLDPIESSAATPTDV